MSTNPDSNTPENDCLPLSPNNTSDVNTEISEELKEVRKRHPQQFMCSYLNINSFRYKLCSIKELLTTNTVDMLIIAETKLDDTFTNSQFEVDNYHLWRADRSSHGGGILVYLRSDLACDRKSKLECQFIESVFVEINFNKDKKFLVSGLYRPPTMSDEQFTKDFNKTFDKILMSYENIIILGDLNYNMMNKDKCVHLQTMCDIFDLENLVKSETCFTKDAPATLLDVILTNKSNLCQNVTNFSIGLTDVYNMVSVQIKGNIPKIDKSFITYRSYKNFDSEKYFHDLKQIDFNFIDSAENVDIAYENFEMSYLEVINKHIP